MADRTTKILLGIIAIALVANLLRPLANPAPVQAQPAGTTSSSIATFNWGNNPPFVLILRENRVLLYQVDLITEKQQLLRPCASEQLPPIPPVGSGGKY